MSMQSISSRKIHLAPFVHQKKEIDRLIRSGRFRDVTEFMRAAIDRYLEQIGRPSLSEQARQMAEDLTQDADRSRASVRLQDRAMASDERW